jgi:hypothetical protein
VRPHLIVLDTDCRNSRWVRARRYIVSVRGIAGGWSREDDVTPMVEGVANSLRTQADIEAVGNVVLVQDDTPEVVLFNPPNAAGEPRPHHASDRALAGARVAAQHNQPGPSSPDRGHARAECTQRPARVLSTRLHESDTSRGR